MGFVYPSWMFSFLIVSEMLVFNIGDYITHSSEKYVSAIGDPGMKNPNVRVALEAWNFCNEVGTEAPNMGSPRIAECADFYCNRLRPGKE